MTDVYIEIGSESETQWRLYTASERPVNTSRFQIENGAWRVTEMEFRPESAEDGTALITITDVEQGAQGKVLATGTLSCQISTGGFTANVQRRAGGDVAREADVMAALKRGVELSFAVDLSKCSKPQGDRSSPPGARVPLAPDVSEFWSARVSGYRIPGHVQRQEAVQFTSLLMGPKEHQVFNVRVEGENQVSICRFAPSPSLSPLPKLVSVILVKTYTLSGPDHQPTPVVTYHCSLGVKGSFHIYRLIA